MAKKYRNRKWCFELTLPSGWREPGFLQRLLFFPRYSSQAWQPEFYGPDRSSIKFAVGPIHPVPSVDGQKRNIERIAQKHGHNVLSTGDIDVNGRQHATMVCEIPAVGTVKNYSLIFGETEYLVTARGDFDICDSIIKTFKPA